MFQRGMLKKEGKRGERGFTKRDAWREVHKIGFAVGQVRGAGLARCGGGFDNGLFCFPISWVQTEKGRVLGRKWVGRDFCSSGGL